MFKEARNMDSLRKTTRREQNQTQKEAMEVQSLTVPQVQIQLSPLKLTACSRWSGMLEVELWDLMFVLLYFDLALFLFLAIILIVTFEMEMSLFSR